MEKVRLLVDMQCLVTLFLVALLWLFSIRLHKQEFFKLWAWAWTSFAVFLGLGALSLRVTPQWLLRKHILVFATVETGFLQIPLLILGAWSLQARKSLPLRRLWPALGLALGAGALSFAVSLMRSEQPLIAFCWRTVLRTVSLAAALVFCAWAFMETWRTNKSWAAAASASFCLLYASDEALYSVAVIRTLILGPLAPPGGTFGLGLLVRPQWLFLDSTYTFGIAVGLVMLLLEEHQRVECALLESDVRGRQMAEDNAALQTEIEKREVAERELRGMSLRLMHAEDAERQRIARELHDEMGAQLLLLTLGIGALKQRDSQRELPPSEELERLSAAAKEIGECTRLLSHQLHPPSLELLGLTSTLSEFCKEFGERAGLHIEFVHAGVPKALPGEIALCIYRIAQEALQNVQKHSGSSEARVELVATTDYVQLSVSDKGKGFAPALVVSGQGLGLLSMAERVRSLGGEFSVRSSPGQGTSVVVSVPIPDISTDELSAAR